MPAEAWMCGCSSLQGAARARRARGCWTASKEFVACGSAKTPCNLLLLTQLQKHQKGPKVSELRSQAPLPAAGALRLMMRPFWLLAVIFSTAGALQLHSVAAARRPAPPVSRRTLAPVSMSAEVVAPVAAEFILPAAAKATLMMVSFAGLFVALGTGMVLAGSAEFRLPLEAARQAAEEPDATEQPQPPPPPPELRFEL